MKKDVVLKDSSGQMPLHVIVWMPDKAPIKIIHICHGMAEYGDRYHEFACFLVNKGIGVVAHDHRQHGLSLRTESAPGMFNREDTFERILQDVHVVESFIRQQWDVPVILLGHSMGSVIARGYVQKQVLSFEKVILSGMPSRQPLLWYLGLGLAHIIQLVQPNKPSLILDYLMVGAFNKTIKNPKTTCDWLSTDPELCQTYESDPLCGYPYTPMFYISFLTGLIQIHRKESIKKMSKDTIWMLQGSVDPVGGNLKKMNQLVQYHYDYGLHQLQHKVFEGMRHEIINEVDKNQVYTFIGQVVTDEKV